MAGVCRLCPSRGDEDEHQIARWVLGRKTIGCHTAWRCLLLFLFLVHVLYVNGHRPVVLNPISFFSLSSFTWVWGNLELDLGQALEVFLILALTYPRYVDSASRLAVLDALRGLVQRDASFTSTESDAKDQQPKLPGLLEKVSKWINNESVRICAASVKTCDFYGRHVFWWTSDCSHPGPLLQAIDSFF